MPTDEPFSLAARAADRLVRALHGARPDVAVVLGSGWSAAADRLGPVRTELPMGEVEGFPPPTVAGHRGTLAGVDVDGRLVVVLRGRSHLYEGHAAATVVHGVRTAVLAGARVVVLTNAAGSVRADIAVGTPMLISDQLNLTGASPLAGPEPPDGFPPRFVDLTDLYAARLRALARDVDPGLREGVYAGLLGGAYETPAEIRMLRTFGADLVGMSTVLEAIAARHLGAEVLGISLVTNLAAGVGDTGLDHQDVLAAGATAAPALGELLRAIIARL